MTIAKQLATSPLISPVNLRGLMKDVNKFMKSYRVLEANVGQAARNDFNNGHIVHAQYLDTMHCVKPSKLYPRDLPNKQCFEDYVGQMGISNDHNIVVYDRSPFGFYAAPRVWWLFKYFGHNNITILNGGINKWNREVSVLSAATPELTPEQFVARENKEIIRNFDQIVENIKTKSSVVVDARPPDSLQYQDESNPQSPPNGHIPGSMNVPYASLFDQTNGTIKDPTALAALFKSIPNDKNKPLIASCLTGMTACSVYLAAELLGYKNLSLYYGSWTEYSQRAQNQ